MSGGPSILLHLGAPYCGTEALHAALSRDPAPVTSEGWALSWTVLQPRGSGWTALSGRSLGRAAARAPGGVPPCPQSGEADPAPLFAALDRVRRKPGGAVPLVSNEAWLERADDFAEALPHWFQEGSGAPVGIFAAVRPPLDWLNAAYWRQGVWTGRGFGSWLERMQAPYVLGAALSRWAALPNTRLRLLPSEAAATGFAAACGLTLPRSAPGGTALPPALLGFLMRNPRYGAGTADSPAESAVRRWCRLEEAPRLWAVLPRHLRALREATASDVDTLFSLLSEAEADAARAADPGWTSEAHHEALLRRGRSPLDDPEELAQLYRALLRGLRAAAEAAGKPAPQLPPVLATRASVHSWDVAVAQALEHLISFDTAQRRWPFGL